VCKIIDRLKAENAKQRDIAEFDYKALRKSKDDRIATLEAEVKAKEQMGEIDKAQWEMWEETAHKLEAEVERKDKRIRDLEYKLPDYIDDKADPPKPSDSVTVRVPPMNGIEYQYPPDPQPSEDKCKTCDGKGKIWHQDTDGGFWDVCPDCNKMGGIK
jgi:hypothetical protein